MSCTSSLRLSGLDATAALAHRLATHLSAGAVVLLSGELGAGKTTFTQFLGASCGVDDDITSPTFTILVPHGARFRFGPGTMVHVDAYRLGGSAGLEEIGLFEMIDGGAVAVIEWGELVRDAFDDYVELELTVEGDDRVVRVEGTGAWGGGVAEDLRGSSPC